MLAGVQGGDERTVSLEATGGAGVEVEVPYVVVVLESARPLAAPSRISLAGLDRLEIGRGPSRAHCRRGDGEVQLTVPDRWMSSRHAALCRDGDGWSAHDLGSKNGTSLGGARLGSIALADGDVIEAGGTSLLFRVAPATSGQIAGLDAEPDPRDDPALTTLCLELERRLAALVAGACSEVPILLVGETGTGKELAARAVHERSKRRGALQAVNCGALPPDLVEGELFGSRRGAYSGALDRPGHVRAAHGGTLFLDEIAELPERAQVALLRVLQEREVTPLGDTRAIPVDLRVVAASQRPLAALVAEGSFRADLYARLSGLEIELSPLRRRREDFGLILGSLVRRLAGAGAETVTLRRSTARALLAYEWPHNIRELERALARALAFALAEDRPIALADLPDRVRARAEGDDRLSPADRATREALVDALARTRGNISATARRLGKARNQIRRWCERLDVNPRQFRR